MVDRRHLRCSVTTARLSSLIPAEYNPRKVSKSTLAALKTSLDRFGVVEPLLANKRPDGSLVLVSGHQRAKALQELGIDEVPVRILNLSAQEERALNLAMNKVQSPLDLHNVDLTLAEVSASAFDTPMTSLGFSSFDVQHATSLAGNIYDDSLGDKNESAQTTAQPTHLEKLGVTAKFGDVEVEISKEAYLEILRLVSKSPDPNKALKGLLGL